MKLLVDEDVHTLKGDSSLHKTEITAANLEQELCSSSLFMVEIHEIGYYPGTLQASDKPQLLEIMKALYPDFFSPPRNSLLSGKATTS